MSSHSSTSIIKCADDVVLGLISNNDETAYLDEVERLMALFHCMVRHGTVRYGSLLGGFPLGTVPGT